VSRSLLAKRLVEPTWLHHPIYVDTFGPAVCDINATANFAPDPEQELILNLIFAINEQGKSAAFEVDIIGPRQNFKTGVIKQAELGWLYVTEERLIVHSAHELDTTAEAFRELAELIENTPSLSKYLLPTRGERPGISEGNGRWSIELDTGQRVKYKARTKGGGRGLTGNKVVLDEAFALQPTHMGALLPTLAAVPDPQVVKASSAGKSDSVVLHEAMNRGRAKRSGRHVYVEYGDKRAGEGCATPECLHAKTAKGCAFDDEKRWATIMPALGRRVTVETVRSMRQAMPPDEFGREFMVWWDALTEAGESPLDISAWNGMDQVETGKLHQVAFGVSVAPDRSRSWIGVAGHRADGLAQVELVATQAGTEWPAMWLATRVEKWNPVAIVLDGTALHLARPLEDLGIEATTTTTRDRVQATVGFFDLFRDDKIRHPGDPQLDAAVESATVRHLLEGFVWEGPTVGPLVAVTLALYGLGQARPAPPPAEPLPVTSSSRDSGGQTDDLMTMSF